MRLCSEDGKVLPEVKEIMEMAAEKKVGIGFGHTDFQELLPLGKLAKDIGVRATLDHPLLELNKLLLDEMKQLRDLGVYVGTYCQPMIPSLVPTRSRSHGNDPNDPRDRPGPLHHRQRLRPGAAHGRVDGMRVFIRALLGFGIKPDEVKVMFKDNPAKLMWLDE